MWVLAQGVSSPLVRSSDTLHVLSNIDFGLFSANRISWLYVPVEGLHLVERGLFEVLQVKVLHGQALIRPDLFVRALLMVCQVQHFLEANDR